MPKIPSYQQSASPEPVRGPRLPTDAGLDTFGGGQSAAGVFGAAANIGNDIQQIAEQERKKQYQYAVDQQAMEAANKITQEEIRLKGQMMNMGGPDALKYSGQIGGDLEKFYNTLEKDLQNGDVRQAVNRHYLGTQNNLGAWAQHTAFVKGKQYDEEQFTAEGKTLLDSVSVDPSMENVVTAAYARKNAIARFAERNGLSPEWVKAQQDEQSSKIYFMALNSLATSGQDMAAKNFFDINRNDFVGVDRIHAQKLVEDSSYRGTAQREVARIFSPRSGIVDGGDGPIMRTPTEKETFEAVDKIEDPVLQDMVRDRVRHRWQDIKRVEDDALKADYLEAANIIEGNPDLDAIPVDVFNRLPLTARRGLQDRVNQIKRGENPPALSDRYFDLLRKSAEKPQEFVRMNMAEERNKLAPTEVKEMAELQAKILKGDDAAARRAHGFLSIQEDAKLTLRSMGISDEDDVATFLRALNRDYMTWKANPKNKGMEPNEDEAQELINKLVKPERVWYKLWLGTRPALQVSKYDDIPTGEREAIEKSLKEAGEAATRGRVIELYMKAHP